MGEIKKAWASFAGKYQGISQFLVFFIISNVVTVFQMILMPLLKSLFDHTALVAMSFQVLPIGMEVGGNTYYIFNYTAGKIDEGGGGGLAYFLAVEIALLAAQVINFFLQRKVTFKSNTGIAKAATWYFIAWIIISVGAAALQGLYKAPIYNFMMDAMGDGGGTIVADIITMLINSVVSFWVFFPIMKFIFKQK